MINPQLNPGPSCSLMQRPQYFCFLALLYLAVLSGCTDDNLKKQINGAEVPAVTTGQPTQSQSIAVTLIPDTVSMRASQTQQFTASVLNSSDAAVTWQVDGVPGGNSSTGTISATGMYTATPGGGIHTVTATSVENPAVSGSARVTVVVDAQNLPIIVTLIPATAVISTTQNQQFNAIVVNSNNSSVTWRVDGIPGGNDTVGAISVSGLYTPLSSVGTHTVTATSVENSAISGSASISITLEPPIAPLAVTVVPANAAISSAQTQQFTAIVVNAGNPAVTWQVDDVQGGSDAVGTISASGLYTPPTSNGTYTVTATSVENTATSSNARIVVTLATPALPIEVTVLPASAAISVTLTQQFNATVLNSSNPAVTWEVDGVQGGSDSTGVISIDGLYTAPESAGTHLITATSVEDATKISSASITVSVATSGLPYRGTLTHHNDTGRTGQNLLETILTPANVNSASFGKLFSFDVDGYVYAQPLYVSNVLVDGRRRNVVYIATEHNSIYAFDADDPAGVLLWKTSFINPDKGITTVPFEDTASPAGYTGPGPVLPEGCGDLTPEIGITGTPVINPATGTLYVVAKTKEIKGDEVAYEHRLHALDIRTGARRRGSGQRLQASVPGSTLPNNGRDRVQFESLRQNQRAALLLSNNVISIAFSSHCVIRPYQGWVLSYDAKTLEQSGAFNVVPNDPKGKGGIWHSGGGPAADADGNIYVMTGDGPFDATVGVDSYSDSVLKLRNGSLALADYFTPFNQKELENANADMSAAGPLLLPDQTTGPPHLMLSLGKQGVAYVINRDNMGKYQESSDSQIVQSFTWGECGTGRCLIFGTPAYFENTVYMAAVGDSLKAYSLIGGRLYFSSQSTNVFPWPGASPVISANGSADGIAWALQTNGSGAPFVLHAYSAANVSTALYSSNEQAVRDNPGPAIKFAVPTVMNGKVYVGSQYQVSVFGLLP